MKITSEYETGCAAWLAELHHRSVKRHRALIESAMTGGAGGRELIGAYFDDVESYLERGAFAGCPFTNAASALEGVVDDVDVRAVRAEVETHKLSVRDFFVDVAGSIEPSAGRAEHLGEALFLMYSGATTEAKNLRDVWPVRRAKVTALQMVDSVLGAPVAAEVGGER